MEVEPLMVDIGGVAKMLKISKRHAQQLDSSGRLGPMPVNLGRCVRWRIAEMESWVAAGCPIRARWVAEKK